MKLAVISDIHVTDINSYIEAFKDVIYKSNIDLLLIGGDICDDVYKSVDFVNKLNKVVKTKYIVGNHDLWNKKNKMLYEQIVNIYENDPNCLLNETLQIGNYKLVASTCWYDYSFGNTKRFSIDDFRRKSYKGITWSDKHYIDINDDILKADEDLKFINNEIRNSDTDVILLTHIVNHANFLGWSNRVDWDYFNAFIGNKRLYELTKNSKVKYAICGHIHFRYSFTENNTNYICACLGNKKEFKYLYKNDDLIENIMDALFVIEI